MYQYLCPSRSKICSDSMQNCRTAPQNSTIFCVPSKLHSSTVVAKPLEDILQIIRQPSGKGRRRDVTQFPVQNQCRHTAVNSATPNRRIFFIPLYIAKIGSLLRSELLHKKIVSTVFLPPPPSSSPHFHNQSYTGHHYSRLLNNFTLSSRIFNGNYVSFSRGS